MPLVFVSDGHQLFCGQVPAVLSQCASPCVDGMCAAWLSALIVAVHMCLSAIIILAANEIPRSPDSNTVWHSSPSMYFLIAPLFYSTSVNNFSSSYLTIMASAHLRILQLHFGCWGLLYGCLFDSGMLILRLQSHFWSSALWADGFVLGGADVNCMQDFVQWCPVTLDILAHAAVTCFSKGCDWGRVTSLEVVSYVSFSTSRWKGRRSAHVSIISVGGRSQGPSSV